MPSGISPSPSRRQPSRREFLSTRVQLDELDRLMDMLFEAEYRLSALFQPLQKLLEINRKLLPISGPPLPLAQMSSKSWAAAAQPRTKVPDRPAPPNSPAKLVTRKKGKSSAPSLRLQGRGESAPSLTAPQSLRSVEGKESSSSGSRSDTDAILNSRPNATPPRQEGKDVAGLQNLRSALGSSCVELKEGIDAAARELAFVRSHASKLRLIPASQLFAPLERAVRDAATTLNKSVRFEASGGDIELDAQVLGAIRDALLHVVRNAVDHGIESPKLRQTRGKSRQGRVHLNTQRVDGHIRFTVSDDGGGFDWENIAKAAGRADPPPQASAGHQDFSSSPEAPSQDPLDQAPHPDLELAFQPGLSTRRKISPLSGRGIGLDVVRKTAERLRGELELDSQPGKGSALSISVPVSLSTIPALIVEAQGHHYSLPLDAAQRVHLVSADSLLPATPGQRLIGVEGVSLPLLSLASLLPSGTPAPRAPSSLKDAERPDGVAGSDGAAGWKGSADSKGSAASGGTTSSRGSTGSRGSASSKGSTVSGRSAASKGSAAAEGSAVSKSSDSASSAGLKSSAGSRSASTSSSSGAANSGPLKDAEKPKVSEFRRGSASPPRSPSSWQKAELERKGARRVQGPPEQELKLPGGPAGPRLTVITIESGLGSFALEVERIIGVRSLTLRPLPVALAPLALSGVAFDSDGTPQPLLDPARLASHHLQLENSASKSAQILVIDDSLTSRMLVRSVLEQRGYRVDTATSGEEALKKAQSRAYDLFVVDVDMPGMDGFEFVSRARSDPALLNIPSIIVSSRDSENDRRKGLASGARGYLPKNRFNDDEFGELVEGLLQ